MTGNAIKNNIDVVIPVYNGAKFILKALESVAQQSLAPNKIIVIDDGSTDNTNKLISEYIKNSKVVVQLVKKQNGGLSSARNAGIRESTAEFVAFLDADDVWEKNKLEKQIGIYQKTEFKNLALVYCNYDVIDSNGIIKYKNYKAPLDKKRMRGMVFKKLLERNQITSSGSGVLIKREIFNTVGLFDEKLRFAEDWDMWLRIAEKYEVDFVPETLVHIRKHDHNMTHSPLKTFENELVFYQKWISNIDGRYQIPSLWSDKITFRIISRLPKSDFIKILKEKISEKYYKKLFRRTFGSLLLYVPIFFIRQIFNIMFYPKYLTIIIGYFRYTGR